MNFISRFWKKISSSFSIPLYLGRNLFRLEKISIDLQIEIKKFQKF